MTLKSGLEIWECDLHVQQKKIDHNGGAKQSNEKCLKKSNKKQSVSTH
jgi:hypothetical protein